VALGVILGSAVAALCCLGLLTAPDGDAAHADEASPQAMSGVSAAAGQLAMVRPVAGGVAAAADVPAAPTSTTTVATTTTQAPATHRAPSPPVTTTPVPTRITMVPTFPSIPHTFSTPPSEPPPPTTTWRHHCRWNTC
jgi:hypothetical protein